MGASSRRRLKSRCLHPTRRYNVGVIARGCFSIAVAFVLGSPGLAQNPTPPPPAKKPPPATGEKRLQQATEKIISDPVKLRPRKSAGLPQSASKYAQAALKLSADWQHGETDHFIVHYKIQPVAEQVAAILELSYAKVKIDLNAAADRATGKSHVFLFRSRDEWARLQMPVPDWAIGVTHGPEFFAVLGERPSASDQAIVAHEVSHLTFNRFVSMHVPLWLNEGFAEFESESAYTKLHGQQNGIPLRLSTRAFSINTLTAATSYPSDPKLASAFYGESERLVRFLLTRHTKARFLQLVDRLGKGATFPNAFEQTYGNQYKKFSDFEHAYENF